MAPRPDLAPDPTLSRADMEALQREIADVAVFADDLGFDPASIIDGPLAAASGNRSLIDASDDATLAPTSPDALPIVAGVDQAFLDERAVSAIVLLQGETVIERVHAVTPLSIPYIPGLLSFREGEAILDAYEELTHTPDLVCFDGSGRIHFRQAGIATHVGVVLDVPSVGVAKRLLCGNPAASVEGLEAGERVAIEANARVDAPAGSVLGYAVQTKQYDSPNRHVNPLYVSPGHRVGPETAADFVGALATNYKLPEPTRLADAYADEVKAEVR